MRFSRLRAACWALHRAVAACLFGSVAGAQAMPAALGAPGARLSLSSGWNLSACLSPDVNWASGNEPPVELVWWPANVSSGHGGCWVWAPRPTDLVVNLAPIRARVESSTASKSGWHFFTAFTERTLQPSNVSRILQWNALTQSYERVRMGELLEPGRGYWALGPEAPGRPPKTITSGANSMSQKAHAIPGAFEEPVTATKSDAALRLPQTALSRSSKKNYAHLTVVVRSAKSNQEQIRYLRSDKAGKSGSFSQAIPIAQLHAPAYVTSLAIAAQKRGFSSHGYRLRLTEVRFWWPQVKIRV